MFGNTLDASFTRRTVTCGISKYSRGFMDRLPSKIYTYNEFLYSFKTIFLSI